MANIKSQIKRNRQNERRRVRNKAIRTALKTDAKKVRTAVEGGATEAPDQLRQAARSLDRAVSKGALHRRAAGRRKSRLAKLVNGGAAESA